MARRSTASNDPLAPVETVIRVSAFFVSASFAVFGLLALAQLVFTGSAGFTINDVGDGRACATYNARGSSSSTSGATYGDSQTDARQELPPSEIRGFDEEAADYTSDTYRVCLTDASTVQQIAGLTGPLAGLAGFYVVGFSVLGVVRSARRGGLFVPETVTRVRRLGWLLLGIGVLVPIIQAAADGIIVRAAIPDRSWYADLDRVGFSWTLLVTAVGVITVARVLDRGVVLQDDVDATI